MNATVECMQKLGGSFIRALAAAWLYGDQSNRRRLEAAFSDYFERYRELANRPGARKEEG